MRILANPTGTFELGGPHADTGLTGRKIIVDTYGGMARHGGGAFSGKDPSKVDRSAAYAARWVAKHVVAVRRGPALRGPGGLRHRRGPARSRSWSRPSAPRRSTPGRSPTAVRELFDLRPAAIIADLDLRRPIYRRTAAYGHFGRNDKEFTWEATPGSTTCGGRWASELRPGRPGPARRRRRSAGRSTTCAEWARLAVGSRVRIRLHGRRVGGWVAEADVEPRPAVEPASADRPARATARRRPWSRWPSGRPGGGRCRWPPCCAPASPERNVPRSRRRRRPPPRWPPSAPRSPLRRLGHRGRTTVLAGGSPPVADPAIVLAGPRGDAQGERAAPGAGAGAERRLGGAAPARLLRRGLAVAGDWAEAAAGWPVVVGLAGRGLGPGPSLGGGGGARRPRRGLPRTAATPPRWWPSGPPGDGAPACSSGRARRTVQVGRGPVTRRCPARAERSGLARRLGGRPRGRPTRAPGSSPRSWSAWPIGSAASRAGVRAQPHRAGAVARLRAPAASWPAASVAAGRSSGRRRVRRWRACDLLGPAVGPTRRSVLSPAGRGGRSCVPLGGPAGAAPGGLHGARRARGVARRTGGLRWPARRAERPTRQSDRADRHRGRAAPGAPGCGRRLLGLRPAPAGPSLRRGRGGAGAAGPSRAVGGCRERGGRDSGLGAWSRPGCPTTTCWPPPSTATPAGSTRPELRRARPAPVLGPGRGRRRRARGRASRRTARRGRPWPTGGGCCGRPTTGRCATRWPARTARASGRRSRRRLRRAGLTVDPADAAA